MTLTCPSCICFGTEEGKPIPDCALCGGTEADPGPNNIHLVREDGRELSLSEAITCVEPHRGYDKALGAYMQKEGLRFVRPPGPAVTTLTSEKFLTKAQFSLIAAFLRYSFRDIDYQYVELTKAEKELGTKEDFEGICRWAREMAGSSSR